MLNTQEMNWIFNHAELFMDETEECNGQLVRCLSWQFQGFVPIQMLNSLRRWFKINGSVRDTRHGLVYTVNVDNGSVSMKTGGTKSTEARINVVFNEYRFLEIEDEYNSEWLAYLS